MTMPASGPGVVQRGQVVVALELGGKDCLSRTRTTGQLYAHLDTTDLETPLGAPDED